MCTLVDDEAVFRQVSSGDAAGISSQQEQDFGRILPDGIHTSLVAQIQRSYLTGHSSNRHTYTMFEQEESSLTEAVN